MKLFVINYRFLFCGDVFTDGLRHAAADLGLAYECAYWDDAQLRAKVERFNPDLIFVVHGRKSAVYGERFRNYPTAVWLVDEPYEVDDTSNWSQCFDTVFVNDPSTLHRHRNAHYLPMCYDPHVHRDAGAERTYKAGFVGNYSPTRLRYLSALAEDGVLDYVVGERWRNTPLQEFCIDGNVPPQRTAELYQQTQVVVNIFREKHHYNVQRIPAVSLNPRIYEALACGAVVVSDRRSGIDDALPELPQFDTPNELAAIVEELLADRQRLDTLREDLGARLAGNTYADRLALALRLCRTQERVPA